MNAANAQVDLDFPVSAAGEAASGHDADGEILVRAKNVRKKFCRSLKRSLWYGMQGIARELNPLSRRQQISNGLAPPLRRDEFWAVDDVTFELRSGECLGLIGHNGAGKTTLLKILNGLIKLDDGYVEMRGRIGALIALGAGFNPILTGRENIYVNAAVLGLTTQEIEDCADEIIEFSGIGEFIDAPVQSYSSGMRVRLGFAVASVQKPDILLIDEVLAVGDAEFRSKCFEKIERLISDGCSIILVSHQMLDIARTCDRVILLDNGRVHFQGSPDQAIEMYRALNPGVEGKNRFVSQIESPKCFINGCGEGPCVIERNTPLRLDVEFVWKGDTINADATVNILSSQEQIISSFRTQLSGCSFPLKAGENTVSLEIPRPSLNSGKYRLRVSLHQEGKRHVMARFEQVPEILIRGGHDTTGVIFTEGTWSHEIRIAKRDLI